MANFYLENQYSTRIDLQDEVNYCIAEDVSGMGAEFESDYIRIGDHFAQNYRNPQMSEISLNLNFFRPGAYDKLQTISNFLLTADALYLVYKPGLSSEIEYRRDVNLSSFKKNGISNGFLCYTLTLKPTSPFYYKRSTKFEVTDLPGEKRYNFAWDSSYNDYANRQLAIPGNNHVEVAFDLEIYGYTENPKIEVIDNTDNIVHELTFPVTVKEDEKIYYSSRDGNIQVKLIDTNGNAREMFNDFDLETNVFFKIPKSGGTICFTSDTDVMNIIIFTAYFLYKVI